MMVSSGGECTFKGSAGVKLKGSGKQVNIVMIGASNGMPEKLDSWRLKGPLEIGV